MILHELVHAFTIFVYYHELIRVVSHSLLFSYSVHFVHLDSPKLKLNHIYRGKKLSLSITYNVRQRGE